MHIVVHDTQEEMRYEGSLVKASSAFKKKDDAASAPVQNSYTSFGEGTTEGTTWKEEDGMREKEQSSRGPTQFLERSHSVKVQVEALEDLLGPEDVDVEFQANPEKSKGARSSKPLGRKRHEFLGG